jgi:arylsulfatase
VLLADGGRFGGISFYIKNNKLFFAHTDGQNKTTIESNQSIPIGKAALKVEVNLDTSSITVLEKVTEVTLFINNEKVGEGTFPLLSSPLIQVPVAFLPYDEGFDIGRDSQTPVTEAYQSPFAFNGHLEKVSIEFSILERFILEINTAAFEKNAVFIF